MPSPSENGSLALRERLFANGGEMGVLMRQLDWSATPLGPPETWSQSLRTIVRVLLTSRYAMWMGWGPQLTFMYNDAYAAMTLGAKHPWALGRPSSEVWSEIWPEIGPRIEKVLTTGEATWDSSLLLFLERNGYPEETYHTFSYSPLSDDDGSVQGHLCVVTEDTERVIAERRLEVLKELASGLAGTNQMRDVFAASEGCLAVDARDLPFTLIYTFEGRHARLVSRTNVPAKDPVLAPDFIEIETLARNWSVDLSGQLDSIQTVPFRPPTDWGSWNRQIVEVFVAPMVRQGQHQTGGILIAGVNPFRRADQSYLAFVSLYVSQIAAGIANARSYEEASQRAEALAELDRAKTLFFTNVSHELRTPLTLILGPVEDLLSQPGGMNSEQLGKIEIAHRNALRLLKLVNALLDFSRLEAGRLAVNYESTDLGKLTEDVAGSFRSLIERAGLSLQITVGPIDNAYVDREMWERIVLNLVSNAFKFTFSGSIGVSLERQDDLIRLKVADTGTGIAESELPKIFDRFHRVAGVRSRTHEGTGIGLALVHELAKLHGGSVDVSSQIGEGTVFTVTIPAGKKHLPEKQISEGPRRSSDLDTTMFLEEAERWIWEDSTPESKPMPLESNYAAESSAANADARILLADDNADMREYLKRLLEQYYVVDAVSDGLAALAAARASPPSLVLTDVMMPNLDGLGLLRELRADPGTATIPIILLSARSGEEFRVEGFNFGADDYLIKPFSAREVLARVRSHLELHRLRSNILAEREELLAREQEARREAELANRSKDEFLAMLGHELRNPLAPILTALQLMQLKRGSGERERAMIERQVHHLARLVDDLLDVSRIARGDIELKRQKIELAEVVAKAVEIASPIIEQRRHHLDVAVPATGFSIDVDPTRIAQVISNLLTNAAKYTEPNGRIEVRAERGGDNGRGSHSHDDQIILRVRDNGIGIDPERFPHIFDLFYQDRRRVNDSQGSLGIGLTIVKNLVALHGGEVEASSEGVGKGSEFVIRLPASRSSDNGTGPGSETSPAANEKKPGAGLRVFVVDDNEDAAELLSEALAEMGHTTAMAVNPVAALEKAVTFIPDVFVIDIGLPIMDGYELVRRLREMPELASTRFFALSGYGRDSDRSQAYRAGFDRHLTKPIDLERLDSLIRSTA